MKLFDFIKEYDLLIDRVDLIGDYRNVPCWLITFSQIHNWLSKEFINEIHSVCWICELELRGIGVSNNQFTVELKEN